VNYVKKKPKHHRKCGYLTPAAVKESENFFDKDETSLHMALVKLV